MPTLLSGTEAVTAGAVSVTITGSFATPYAVSISPDWNTGFMVTGKTSAQFVVTFAVPVPAGGGNLDWIVSAASGVAGAAGTVTLADYRTVLRRLLHDTNDVYWTLADKDSYLNEGIGQRDLDTGGNRSLITFVLTVADDTYTFTDLGNTRVFDIVGINLIYNNLRIVLDQFSFSELNAQVRQYSPPYQWAPLAWARYGPNQVVFAPAPSIAYTTEWDCCLFSSPLVNASDTDPLPYPYTQAVTFYAAYKAKLARRQFDEAESFLRQYQDKVLNATNARTGFVPSLYPSTLARAR